MYNYVCEISVKIGLTKFDSSYRRKGIFPLFPEDQFIKTWNIIMIFLLIFSAFWVTFIVAFMVEDEMN